MRRVALVLDGHGWAVRAVVRSLGAAGWHVIAPARTKSARSRYCAESVSLPDYKHDVDGFCAAVGATIRDRGVELVVPAEDGSLELLYETDGLLGDARVLGGDRASARLALDKSRTLMRARQAGFATPPYAEPESVEEAVAAGGELGFPCVVKPRRSYARAGNAMRSARLTYAFSPGDVRRAVQDFLAGGFEMPLVQAWVPGRSIGVATVWHARRLLGFGVREAFSQYPIRGGSAVWRATVSPRETGVDQALGLMRAVGFEGLGDVQYHIARDGTPTLMEIGARTYGWLPLTIAAGADLPLIAARALDGHEPAETVVAVPGLHMRWPRGEVARLAELANPRVQLPPGASRRDVLGQLRPVLGSHILYDGVMTGDARWPAGVKDLLTSGRRRARRNLRPAPIFGASLRPLWS
jgi:carbamoyl-phosphate synthase large subunit